MIKKNQICKHYYKFLQIKMIIIYYFKINKKNFNVLLKNKSIKKINKFNLIKKVTKCKLDKVKKIINLTKIRKKIKLLQNNKFL